MPESFRTKLDRWFFNFFPAYRGTGGRVAYIASDWREVKIRLPLNWRTRNYVKTIYGGSMYGAIDPMYMLMLLRALGKDYIVWDKAATIRFKKPGTQTLYAHFKLTEAEINEIKNLLEHEKSVDRNYLVQLVDEAGVVHAEVDKVIYIKKKRGMDA